MHWQNTEMKTKNLGFNKKGLVAQIFTVLIIFLALMGIVIIYVFIGFFTPLFANSFSQISDELVIAGEGTSGLNSSVRAVVLPVNEGIQNLQWLSYTLLIFLFFGFCVLCFFVRTYPFLMLFWIFFVLVLVICGVFLSHSYNQVNQDSQLGAIYQRWGTNHLIMSHLPHIITVMGFMGGSILFFVATRDSASDEVVT